MSQDGLRSKRNRRYYLKHQEELKSKQRERNKDKGKKRDTNRLHRYGLTNEDFQRMLDEQKGLCLICENILKPGRDTHVDHCHRTNAVRGLLCSKCNKMLGLASDNPQTLIRAASYLERF